MDPNTQKDGTNPALGTVHIKPIDRYKLLGSYQPKITAKRQNDPQTRSSPNGQPI